MSNNILQEFFTNLADAVRLKLNEETEYKPTEIADKIGDIDSKSSGSFYEEVECFVPNGTKSVTYVVVSKEVTDIKAGAYAKFTNLTDVVFLGDVTTIGQSAFDGCTSLSRINLSDSLKRVDGNAFRNCSSLEEINFTDNLTYVGATTFNGSAWYAKQAAGVVYAGRIACGYKGTMTDGVVEFKEGTYGTSLQLFYDNKNVISVKGYISNNVESHTFALCTNLKSVELHQKDGEAIALQASSFQGCTSLEEVYFDNIKALNSTGIFQNCPNMRSICLLNKDSSSVEAITSLVGLSVFKGNTNVTIYVADGTIDAWKKKLGNNGEGYQIALYSEKQ